MSKIGKKILTRKSKHWRQIGIIKNFLKCKLTQNLLDLKYIYTRVIILVSIGLWDLKDWHNTCEDWNQRQFFRSTAGYSSDLKRN